MAGGFLFQMVCSGTSRSAALLGAASARAAAPVTRTVPAARKSQLDCFGGARRTFSSSATNKQAPSQAKMHHEGYSGAELLRAMNKSANTTIGLFAFAGLCWIYMWRNNSSYGRKSCCGCCNCQCHGLNPEVNRN